MTTNNDETGRLLNVRSVAETLSVSVFTVRQWIRDGRLRVVRLGRRVLVPESEVRALIARNTVEPTAAKELQL